MTHPLQLSDIHTIAVIGAGTMGSGIAQVCASAGYRVALIDIDAAMLDRALATIHKSVEKLHSKEKLTDAQRDAALSNITTGLALDAVRDADIVIEAASENPAVKQNIFKQIDAYAPAHAILATNTSSISITEIAAVTGRAEQVIGMHFMNPVPLMTLVEIIRGLATGDDTLATVMALSEHLGKTPVEAQDYPGFIANRILAQMLNEAIYALMEGVGTVEAIDTVMKLGMNHPMGPLQLADFIGLDVLLHILDVMHEGLGDPKYRACPLLKKMVAAGYLGRKSGRGFYTYDA